MARWLGLSATPLVPSGTLGGLFGLGSLSFKLESRNPAGSWLDRSGALAVAAAYADGAAGLLTWSSVALATALALSANRLRLRTVFLQAVRPDPPPWPAVLATLGAQVVRVDTTQGALQRAAPALARRHGLQVLDADDPFVRAGLWTLPFEIADDAEPRPDLVILPRLAGNEADWCRRGFEIWSALAGGPSPRVVAALVGERTHLPAELAACDEVSVLPREVGAARRLLARQEGLLASTSGAAGVAALARMAHAKVLPLGARVVVVLAAEYGADVCQPPAAEEQPALTPISLTALRRDADRVLMTPPM
ncbi:MAG: pyridoxal-phosphate dependent enzyme [Chloroflexi bacterium]|nr:pyridoxal-phosphate dependent enzyme [Chloroflexota bacterium]